MMNIMLLMLVFVSTTLGATFNFNIDCDTEREVGLGTVAKGNAENGTEAIKNAEVKVRVDVSPLDCDFGSQTTASVLQDVGSCACVRGEEIVSTDWHMCVFDCSNDIGSVHEVNYQAFGRIATIAPAFMMRSRQASTSRTVKVRGSDADERELSQVYERIKDVVRKYWMVGLVIIAAMSIRKGKAKWGLFVLAGFLLVDMMKKETTVYAHTSVLERPPGILRTTNARTVATNVLRLSFSSTFYGHSMTAG